MFKNISAIQLIQTAIYMLTSKKVSVQLHTETFFEIILNIGKFNRHLTYNYAYILDDCKQYTELTHRTRLPPNLETS